MSGLSGGGRDSQPSPAWNTSHSATMAGVLPGTGFLAGWGALPWSAWSPDGVASLPAQVRAEQAARPFPFRALPASPPSWPVSACAVGDL